MSLQSSSAWRILLALALPIIIISPCWSAPPVGESIWLFHVNNQSYTRVDSQDSFQLKAKDTATPGFDSLLMVEAAGSGNVVFKSALNDLYVRVDNGNSDKLVADSSNPSDPLTQFTWTDLPSGKVRLTSVGDPDSTKNISPAGAEEILRANRSGTNSDTEFLWEIPGPRIADTIYSDFDTPLITIDAVAEFGADNTGATDASIAIQAAIDAAFNEFGGIIYLPAGSYLLQNPIILRKSCTLRGDWKQPTDSDKSVAGSVLLIDHGAGSGSDPADPAAIAFGADTAIRDLSIFYPSQSPSAPIEYPFTLEGDGSDFIDVRNVTLVNSYRGIRMASGSASKALINSVYGSPIHRGIEMDKDTNIFRLQNANFAPEYWSESGLGSATNRAAIIAGIRSSNGIAFYLGDGDGASAYTSLFADGYDIGLQTFSNSGASSRFFDVTLINCRIGIDIPVSKGNPYLFAAGFVDAEQTALKVRDAAKSCEFNSFTFQSGNIIADQDTGNLSLVNCDFLEWGAGYAIDSSGGKLVVAGCSFGENNRHIKLRPSSQRASVYGNTVSSGASLDVLNNSSAGSAQIVIDTTSVHTFAQMDSLTYPFLKQDRLPSPPPGTSHVFDVFDYGATGDAFTDDTQAIQDALDAAGLVASASSGCIVFLPPGAYNVQGRLSVPSFVELRGVHDSMFGKDSRSLLCSFADKGILEGIPFIKLAANSGLRGIAIYRPEQTWNSQEGDQSLIEYPYAIEGTDRNWAYNINLVNTYDGIDFRQGGGHHLEGLFINALRRTIDLRADGAPTVLENYIFKTEPWRTARNYSLPGFVSQNWADGCPSGSQDQGLPELGFGPRVYGDGIFRFMGSYINATGDETYKFEGSPTVNMYLCGAEKIRAGAPIFGLEILSDDTGNMDFELVGNSWNINGATSSSQTNLGDRLTVLCGKNVGIAPVVHEMTGAGRIILNQDWMGRAGDAANLKLSNDTKGNGT
ncbi:MAG: glycosyl hydrolase family 28-related protein [Verrucomicrobiota bacterium]